MKLRKLFLHLVTPVLLSFSIPVFADGPTDTSSDAAQGFLNTVTSSKAVVLRVPINERGEENTELASMKVYSGEQDLSQGTAIINAWDQGTSVDDHPIIDGDTPTDSSTWGWYSYRRYGYGGWARPYYYSSYTPSAYYYGSSYYYSYPSYYSSYYGGYGYRYYYYGCY